MNKIFNNSVAIIKYTITWRIVVTGNKYIKHSLLSKVTLYI